MLKIFGAVVVALAACYFGAERLLLGHHFFARYSVDGCLENVETKTMFRIEGNAKDSYLARVERSGNTIPGSYQEGRVFALDIEATDSDSAFQTIPCPPKP